MLKKLIVAIEDLCAEFNKLSLSCYCHHCFGDHDICFCNNQRSGFIVAVSGGADSMSLAVAAKEYSIKKKERLLAVIVDHKLRSNSTQEAKKVESLLQDLSIETCIVTWSHTLIVSKIQEQARKARYMLLSALCKMGKYRAIMTAHHLNDQIETFFMRAEKNSEMRGLACMKPIEYNQFGEYVLRPFLKYTKEEIAIANLYIHDPSNNNINFQRVRCRNILQQNIVAQAGEYISGPLSATSIEWSGEFMLSQLTNWHKTKSISDQKATNIMQIVNEQLINNIIKVIGTAQKYHEMIEKMVIAIIKKEAIINYYLPMVMIDIRNIDAFLVPYVLQRIIEKVRGQLISFKRVVEIIEVMWAKPKYSINSIAKCIIVKYQTTFCIMPDNRSNSTLLHITNCNISLFNDTYVLVNVKSNDRLDNGELLNVYCQHDTCKKKLKEQIIGFFNTKDKNIIIFSQYMQENWLSYLEMGSSFCYNLFDDPVNDGNSRHDRNKNCAIKLLPISLIQMTDDVVV